MKFYVLVNGDFELNEEMDFGNGLKIEAIDDNLSIFDFAVLGSNGFSQWALLEPYLNLKTFQIISDYSGAIDGGYDLLNRVWLLSAILNHKKYGLQCLASSTVSWNDFVGLHKKNLNEQNIESHFSLLDFHTEIIKNPSDFKKNIQNNDMKWIQKYYESYNTIAHNHSNFRIALGASTNWRYSRSPRLAVASLWSGIEAIFSINNELSYRLALSIAILISNDPIERKQIYKDVKKLYGMRSKAVHGSEMSDKKILDTIHNSYEILCKIIIRIVENENMIYEDDILDLIFS